MRRRWPHGTLVRAGVTVALVLGLTACGTTGGPQLPVDRREEVFFPAPPERARIQFLTSFNDSREVQLRPKESALQRFIVGGTPETVFTMGKPYGVAMDRGAIFVCDTRQGIVHVFDFERKAYDTLGRAGRGKLQKPINLTVAPDGTRYVADIGRGQVVVFGPDNRYMRALGDPDEWSPTACALVGRELFVVDIKDHEIEQRDPETGARVNTFGEAGAEAGQLFKPTNITADAEGRLYVSDTINMRVQVFDRDGQFEDSFGEPGDTPGSFARPKGIAVDPEGLVYVVDAAFENVQIFNPESELLLFFGGSGGGPGDMKLPAGITISTEGLDYFRQYVAPGFEPHYLIIVVNQFGGRRVSVYARGEFPDEERDDAAVTPETE